MRVRIHRHVIDLAGSALVLVGFLLAAMVLSAIPAVVQTLTRHGAPPAQSAQSAAAPGVGAAGRAAF